MATAKETIAMALLGQGCLGKAADDEPVFVLRAQDMSAASCVLWWCRQASITGCPPEKIAEAERCATAMMVWPNRKMPD